MTENLWRYIRHGYMGWLDGLMESIADDLKAMAVKDRDVTSSRVF